MQNAEQSYDQATAASLEAMLAQTLGVGKAQVLVYANMNVDQTTKESLEYGKAGVPLQQSKSLETLTGNGSGAAATGTANLPAATQSGGKSNYKNETIERPRSASTRRSPTRRSRRGPSKASTSRCCSTTRSRPPRCRRSRKR